MTLPKGWAYAKLGDLVSVVRARFDPQEHPGLPFVGMDNVEAHTMKLLGTVPAASMRSASVHFIPGDVLYGRLRPYLNKVLTAKFEGLASAEFIPLTPGADVVSDYIRYRINAADFVTFASHLDEGDRPRVDWAGISQFEIATPPSNEQQRIVEAIDAYLSRLDAAVASLERVQTKLKAYRASILKAAVEGRLVPTEASIARAEKRNYEPANLLLERILKERRKRWEQNELAKFKAAGKTPKDDKWKAKYEEPAGPDTKNLPELPEGWCWTTLLSLLREPLRNGHSARESADGSGLRTLTLTAVTVGDFSASNTKMTVADADKVADLWLESGDIFVERANTPELVGLAALYRGPQGFAIFPDLLIRVRCAECVVPEYLESVLLAPASRRYFQRAAQGIAGSMPKISQTMLEAFPVPLPPVDEQTRIVSELQRLSSVKIVATESVSANLRRCARLRQAILKWAFQGKLTDQNPNDQPAQLLLQRILLQPSTPKSTPKSKPKSK